jgi:hypothetical protein
VNQIKWFISYIDFNTCAGKLANVVGKICSRRLTRTSKNTLTPFYGVKIGASSQVNVIFYPFNSTDPRRFIPINLTKQKRVDKVYHW